MKNAQYQPHQSHNSIFISLTSINKKGYDFEQLVGNTCIKRNYFLNSQKYGKTHTKTKSNIFDSINQLTSLIIINLKQSKTQECILMNEQFDHCMSRIKKWTHDKLAKAIINPTNGARMSWD
jgi:hypothetical protein